MNAPKEHLQVMRTQTKDKGHTNHDEASYTPLLYGVIKVLIGEDRVSMVVLMIVVCKYTHIAHF